MPWFAVLGMMMVFGCTTEDGSGDGGGKPGSDSGIEGDEDIEYPECSPGFVKMFATIANDDGKLDMEYPATDPYITPHTLQFTLDEDGFLFLSYPYRNQLEERFDHLLHVTGGLQLPGSTRVITALPGSTAFIPSAPESPWQFAYIHFHIFSELQKEFVGCMAPPVLP